MKVCSFSSCLLAGVLLGFPATAAADTLLESSPGNDTSSAAVAYNSTADQYLVVYEAEGGINGQLRDGDGTHVDTIVGIVPRGGLSTTLREPRVTYREASDQYVVVFVSEAYPTATFPPGPTDIPVVDVNVVSLDPDGSVMWGATVPKMLGETTQEAPDVLADTFPDPGCCTLVTWKSLFGTIYGQQYRSDGTPSGARVTIYQDGGETSSHAFSPRIAYGRLPNDEFVVAYQLGRNGPAGEIWARTVQPVGSSMGAPKLLTQTDAAPWPRYGQKFPGGVDIAYDEVGQTYYVAWRDESRVYVARPDANLNGWAPYTMLDDASFFDLRGGTPEVIVAEGYGKAFVTHPVLYASMHWTKGQWFTRTGAFAPSSLSTSVHPRPVDNVVGGFSPVTDQVFGVWEVDEASWVSPPPNDLFYSLGTVP